jgi:hypothetical protein
MRSSAPAEFETSRIGLTAPDDIIIFHRAGIAELVGPFSAEEKAEWKQKLEVGGRCRRSLQTAPPG